MRGRRVQARPLGAAAPRGRRRRREERGDRGSIDRGQGHARTGTCKRPTLSIPRTASRRTWGTSRPRIVLSCVASGRRRSTVARSAHCVTATPTRPRHPSERRAARWYRLRGYRLLGTNVWVAGYELDVIARRRGTIVFCEVKSKAGERFGDPLEMVDAEKVRRVRRAAEAWARVAPRDRRHARPLRRGRDSRRTAGAGAAGFLSDPANLVRDVSDPGRALCRSRSRSLVVGERASRARAHEARPPAAPLPRQVHPATRGRALAPSRPSWWTRTRSIRRFRTTLVQGLESGHPSPESIWPRSTAC